MHIFIKIKNNVLSVDSGKHMDWGGSTEYMSYWNIGVDRWNNYKNGVIRKDTLTTIQDVTINILHEDDKRNYDYMYDNKY